jgi:hypothetical protein
MNAPVQLPPERDVPPGSLAITEAHLVQLVGSRREPRWLVPVAAAAAVLAIVAVAVGIQRLSPAHDTTAPAAPPVAWDPGSTKNPRLPGVTAVQARAIVTRCVAHRTWKVPAAKNPRIYNLVGTPVKGTALVISDNDLTVCQFIGSQFGGESAVFPVRNDAAKLNWLTAPYSVDYYSRYVPPGRPQYWEIAGRVMPEVRSVKVAVLGRVYTAQAVNGTFLLHQDAPAGSKLGTSQFDRPESVWLFDKGGKQITAPAVSAITFPTNGLLSTIMGMCIKRPDGTLVGRGVAGAKCVTGLTWR